MKLINSCQGFVWHALLLAMGIFGIAAIMPSSPGMAFVTYLFVVALLTMFYLVEYALEVVAMAVISIRDKAEADRSAVGKELAELRTRLAELDKAHSQLREATREFQGSVRGLNSSPALVQQSRAMPATELNGENDPVTYSPYASGDFHADGP